MSVHSVNVITWEKGPRASLVKVSPLLLHHYQSGRELMELDVGYLDPRLYLPCKVHMHVSQHLRIDIGVKASCGCEYKAYLTSKVVFKKYRVFKNQEIKPCR